MTVLWRRHRAQPLATRPRPAVSVADWQPADEALFQALRACRQELARSGGVPAYVVAHDRTLHDLALLRPRTLDDLGLAHGLGPTKIARYGAAFLEVIAESRAAPGRDATMRAEEG